MSNALKKVSDPAHVLGEAFLNAGKELGLGQKALTQIINRNRSSIGRSGIDPTSKSGELALLLIRIYRALFVLVGGDTLQISHWMHTVNHHIGGVPAEQVLSIQGLVRVLEYLDAMRGKL